MILKLKFKTVFVLSFTTLFFWQGVADAASISTRVRVLESKVAKHDKQLADSVKMQQQGQAEIDRSLAKMKAMEKKMQKMLEQDKSKKNAQGKTDKRYAFP